MNLEDMKISNMFDLSKTIAAPLFEGKTYPWEVLPEIKDFIIKLGKTLPSDEYLQLEENVWVHKTAKIMYKTAYLGGPLIVMENAEIRQCAFIRGSAIVGRGTVVGNSTELKNVILFDNVQVPHYNYVGDSILGYKSHMGAGSITSNVKSDKKPVVIHTGNKETDIETGFKKMGAILGDNVEVGCGSVLNPGTVIGQCTNIYPLSSVRGFVPAHCIYKMRSEVAEKIEQ